MVNRATASNKNNIIIHNVVNAETKKRKQRRRQYQNMQAPQVMQQAVPFQQLAPQVFPQQVQLAQQQSGADPDLVQAVRDSVSSQAAMLNEFRDQRDRENEMLAAGINAVTQNIGDRRKAPYDRGIGPGSFGAKGDVETEATEPFADEEQATFGGNSNIPAARAEARIPTAEEVILNRRGKLVSKKKSEAAVKGYLNRMGIMPQKSE